MLGSYLVDDGDLTKALKSLLTRVTSCPARSYSHCEFGRTRQNNAISVLLKRTDNEDWSTLGRALRGRPGDYLHQIRSELPEKCVCFLGNMQWLPPEGTSVAEAFGIPKLPKLSTEELQKILSGDSSPFKERLTDLKEVPFAFRRDAGIELVVATGETQFEILRVAKTLERKGAEQANKLTEQLRNLDQDFEIDIIHADAVSVSFLLCENAGGDSDRFARTLLAICPALESMETHPPLSQRAKQGELFRLWWD